MKKSLFAPLAFILLIASCASPDSGPDISKLELIVDSIPFEIIGDNYIKTINFINLHESEDFEGILTIKVISNNDDLVIYKSSSSIVVAANSETDHIFTFSAPQSESYKIKYIYKLKDSKLSISEKQSAPYILTPPVTPEPRINGPDVLGSRARSPLLYKFPVTGSIPMTYKLAGLPDGIVFDSINGSLQGSIRNNGIYPMTLFASNSLGESSKEFSIHVGDSVQLIDTISWSDWLGWDPYLYPGHLTVDEQYAQVSLRCLQGPPFLFNKVSGMDDFTMNLLCNNEVLAVNQDALCDKAELIYNKDSIQVWSKDLADGSQVVGIFNMDKRKRNPTIAMRTLGLSGTYTIRDLWRQEDIGEASDELKVSIYPQGVFLIKLKEK
jgi:hypothetical protein